MDLVLFEEIALNVAKSGVVTSDHVRAVRANVYPDLAISQPEAEGIYAIERARRVHNDEWTAFFIEALCDHLIGEPPAGYLSEDKAAWLQDQVRRRKNPSMDGDVALVAGLIERAQEVPPSFSAFALRLAKDAVVFGDGPGLNGGIHASGRVTDADVALLNRILWGAGSEGQLAISREEAEALFAIADATTGADNTPAFEDLFARAIGNYLVGATGRDVPSRQEALEWSKRGEYKANVVNALSSVFDITWQDVKDGLKFRSIDQEAGYASEAEHGRRNMARDEMMASNRVLSAAKTDWLVERIGRNGITTPAERALLRFVIREGGQVNPALKAMLDAA